MVGGCFSYTRGFTVLREAGDVFFELFWWVHVHTFFFFKKNKCMLHGNAVIRIPFTCVVV